MLNKKNLFREIKLEIASLGSRHEENVLTPMVGIMSILKMFNKVTMHFKVGKARSS
jgi:hypothetical protein